MRELMVYEVGSDRRGWYSRCGMCGEKTRDAVLIRRHICEHCGQKHDKVMRAAARGAGVLRRVLKPRIVRD